MFERRGTARVHVFHRSIVLADDADADNTVIYGDILDTRNV